VWLLALALIFSAMPSASLDRMVLLATIPAAWTIAIVSAYCQTVLGTSRAGARWRAGLHCVAIWAIGLELIALTAGGWFQIAGALTRLLP
jgi:hypothetical protein